MISKKLTTNSSFVQAPVIIDMGNFGVRLDLHIRVSVDEIPN